MNMDQKTYEKYVKSKSPKSPLFTDCIKAFLFGGLICIIGEIFYRIYLSLDIKEDVVKILVPSTLIAIAAILTGVGLFDGIAKHAGAGTLVPITGFSNAVVSPAIDNKAEGFVMGLGAKLFVVAGPVIVYGTVASVLYGVVYWLMQHF